jgi:hypothetical protein
VAYKQQILTSHSSKGWRTDIRVPEWSGSDEIPLPGCHHMEQREGAGSQVPSYEVTNFIHEDPTLITKSPSKGPSS